MQQHDGLLAQALALSAEERAQLAQAILDSLIDNDIEDDALRKEWTAEIGRRLEELKSGAVETSSWDALHAELVATESQHGG